MITLEQIKQYHQKTKHTVNRLASSPGFMDWENQPDPYRFYRDTARINLTLLTEKEIAQSDLCYDDLYAVKSIGSVSPRNEPATTNSVNNLTLASLSVFFQFSMALSIWKGSNGSQWALRMNPSSGNLHPTETYVLLPKSLEDQSITAGVYHYNPFFHALEKIASIGKESDIQGFGIIVSSIPWREAWKYGTRAFRYVNHDVGHALGSLAVSGNLQNWKLQLESKVLDTQLDHILGFDQIDWSGLEKEHVDCLVWMAPHTLELQEAKEQDKKSLFFDFLKDNGALEFHYTKAMMNQLSKEEVIWDLIEDVVKCTRYDLLIAKPVIRPLQEHKLKTGSRLRAYDIIRKRRSAQAYDRAASQMTFSDFLHLLERTQLYEQSLFEGLNMPNLINLVLFVHQVVGLESGLYMFIRNREVLADLQLRMSQDFKWEPIAGDLYLLKKGDFRKIAREISCHQEIASDSCFSLGMLAGFESIIAQNPVWYKRLFWEAGLIGQILYLEAESIHLRGTGIGCFFDDVCHDLLGLKDSTYQDLYHFTIGSAMLDTRLVENKPYFFRD
ncbi:MAG: SagB/ThcOx family dehydrogenase [bacterium]|nr:SagB/ThcOx family dehydrogenase [bacterium]